MLEAVDTAVQRHQILSADAGDAPWPGRHLASHVVEHVYLELLVGDDAFRQPPQHLIAAAWIVEVSLSHVDGALMVASHLFDECEVYLGGAWIELPVRSDDKIGRASCRESVWR